MSKTLLFLPDISGFTEFVQNTEAEHSQHVIAELLEVMLEANTLGLHLAEVEGDALFFYKEGEIPSQERLLAQAENIFTAFHSHLKLMETNRICPCSACAAAPKLQLKIIAHYGETQILSVQDKRKPFGAPVIEAHRLMKNSVDSGQYFLVSEALATEIMMQRDYQSRLFQFRPGKDQYDGKEIPYFYSLLNRDDLKLQPFTQGHRLHFDRPPDVSLEYNFPIAGNLLLEYITNYRLRYQWAEGVDRYEYNENEVTRLGTEHVCVINGKHLDFITVTKDGKPGQLVYGEQTEGAGPIDQLYQFFVVTPLSDTSSKLESQTYVKVGSFLKKIAWNFLVKKAVIKNTTRVLDKLLNLVKDQQVKIPT